MADHGPLIGDAGVARDMADVIRAVITSEAWHDADGVPAQVEMLTLALCDGLSERPMRRIPSLKQLRGEQAVRERNAAIRRVFDGRNYLALAAEHNLSLRQIRRIVDDPRTERRRRKE